MTTFETRWATAEDVAQYWGERPALTQRAQVGVLDGEVVAMWALVLTKTGVGLISDIRPELKHMKVTIHRTAKNFLRQAEALGFKDIQALADPDIPGSSRWIEALGFEFVCDTDDGELWRWQPHYHS